MTKLKDDQIKAAFQHYLKEDEELKHWAFDVKQPNIFLIILLLFGAKNLPDIAKNLGKGIKGFKKEMRDTEEEKDSKDEKKQD